MPSFLVFCTTDISPEFWAEVVDRSGAEQWALVRSPDDIQASDETERDIEPFESGFKDHSVHDIENTFRSYIDEGFEGITEHALFILDERSKTDGTIHITFVTDDPEFREDIRFRAKFERANNIAYCLLVKENLILEELEEKGNDAYEQ